MRHLFMWKKLPFFLLATLTIASTLVLSAFVMAQGSSDTSMLSNPLSLGQVTSLAADKTSLVMQSGTQDQIVINLDQKTVYSLINSTPYNLSTLIDLLAAMSRQKAFPGRGTLPNMPGMSPANGSAVPLSNLLIEGSFDNIEVGDMVMVKSLPGNPAAQIYDFKFPDNIKFTSGILSGIADKAMVITPPSPALGQAVSLAWDDNSTLILKGLSSIQIGQSITVIYDGSANIVEIAIISASGPVPSTTPIASPSATPSPSASPSTGVDSLDLTIQNSKFDKTFMAVSRGAQVSLNFSNKDSGVQHNFSLYNNRTSTNPIFKGTPITGPANIVYQFTVDVLNATYFYRCDIHPNENGQLMVGTAGE